MTEQEVQAYLRLPRKMRDRDAFARDQLAKARARLDSIPVVDLYASDDEREMQTA